VTDGIHAVVLIQLNGMSSNAGGLLKFHEYIQPLGPTAPTIGTVKSCRINTARSSNWRATGPSRSEAMLPVAQDCSSELIGFLCVRRNSTHAPHLSPKRSISAQACRARRDERNLDDNSNNS
jgi:hypothetical protein